MANQVIKQPNGLFAIFSNGVNGIVRHDMTEQDYINRCMHEARKKALRDARYTIKLAREHGTSSYKPFDESWESAYKLHLEAGYDPIELKEVNDAQPESEQTS